MHDFLDWFQTTDIFSLSLVSLSLALAATLISYLLMRISLRFAVGRMRKIAPHTTNRVDDTVVEVLSSTNRWLMLLAALPIGLGMLDLNERWNCRVGQLWFVAVALQLGLWLTRAISIGLRRYQDRHILWHDAGGRLGHAGVVGVAHRAVGGGAAGRVVQCRREHH